jgi:hypothetical protein
MSSRRQNINPYEWKWTPEPNKLFEIPRSTRKSDALATKSYVQSCMRTVLEKKTIVVQNIVGNSGVPTSSGRVDPLQSFNVQQGTGDGNRTGNFIRINKVWIRWITSLPVGTPSALFRVIVLRDRQTNGSTPVVADIIEFATGGGAAGYNDDNVKTVGGDRFTIISDKWFAVNSSLGASDATSGTHYTAWTQVVSGSTVVHYKANAGAITDVVSGETFVLTYCNQAAGNIQGQVQIEFQDQ